MFNVKQNNNDYKYLPKYQTKKKYVNECIKELKTRNIIHDDNLTDSCDNDHVNHDDDNSEDSNKTVYCTDDEEL